ncbi:MAG: DUF4232 domain-containing protein [Jatrophihabitans sp.]|uniref:DUF4232 domain-containing protein n=1 Tax=Jatrophihabitans sp. TaxID=1932789 RepID=UPI003F820BE6
MNRLVPLTMMAVATVAGGVLVFHAESASATTSACTGPHLHVAVTQADGATGHGSLVVQFENVGTQACTLTGYPGLDALGPHGGVLAHARRTVSGFAGGSSHGVRTVTVRPDHWASATVEWLNFDPVTAGDCRFSASIATTPPNTAKTVHRARSVSVCDLQVHPAVAGRSGRG